MPPRILVSNDDGIDATGINALAEALEPLGEVWVCAPDRERSAVSHSISLHMPLRMKQQGPRRFAVDGTPTDSVYMGMNALMPEPPDIVVSGINHGPNLGSDVLYSGTVAAAMEGAVYGQSAIAASLAISDFQGGAPDKAVFDAAATFVRNLAQAVLAAPTPPGVVLNVNVPPSTTAPSSYKLCRLGFSDWSDDVVERRDPRGKPYYWIAGARCGHDEIADSDNDAIADGFVSVTPIHYDITDYRSFAYTRGLQVGLERVDDALGDQPLQHPTVRPRRKSGVSRD